MRIVNLISIIPFFFLFFDYDYFLITGLTLGILVYKDKIKTLNLTYFVKTSFFLFYTLRILSGFDDRFNNFWQQISQKNYSLDGKFIDLQSVFLAFKCNYEKVAEYQFLGTEQIFNCPHTVSYGPFFEIIGFPNDPLVATFLTVCISILLIFYIYQNVTKNLNSREVYITTLIFLSPPINFVLERFNFDILIYLSVFLIYKFVQNNIIKNLLLFILVLMKFYPIFIIFGNLIFNLIKENKKEFKEDLFFLLNGLFLISLFSLSTGIDTVRPFRPDRTFGILSQSLNFNNQFNWENIYIYPVIIILVLVFFSIQFNSSTYPKYLDNNLNHVLVVMFILLSLFANYDYRLSFLVLISTYIVRSKNNMLFYSYFIFLFSSPGLLNSYNNLFQLTENYQFVYFDIPFYFFLSAVIIDYFSFLKINLKNLFK